MKTRFIVLLENPTAEQHLAFRGFIAKNGLGFWKWVGDSWLLTTTNPSWNASNLVDSLENYYPRINKFIVELRPDGQESWAGFGPNDETNPDKNMFAWLHRNWKPD